MHKHKRYERYIPVLSTFVEQVEMVEYVVDQTILGVRDEEQIHKFLSTSIHLGSLSDPEHIRLYELLRRIAENLFLLDFVSLDNIRKCLIIPKITL